MALVALVLLYDIFIPFTKFFDAILYIFSGFQMLQKLGWSEGQGLGSEGSGRVEPVNKYVHFFIFS